MAPMLTRDSSEAALNRMPIGLHPGAAKLYKEKGVLK